MAKDPNLITQAAYARSRKARGLSGGTREAVRVAVAEKRISAFGAGKLIDPDLADTQWQQNSRRRMGPEARRAAPDSQPLAPAARPTESANAPGFGESRARREHWEADKAEMEAGRMRNSLWLREDVDRALFELGREMRDRLTAVGRRIASEVASIATAEGCEVVIDREHRLALQTWADGIREKLGQYTNEEAT